MSITVLNVKIKFVTPAFLRREVNKTELRMTSIKGVLRRWYEIWNPKAFDISSDWWEGNIFGYAGEGKSDGGKKSPFIMQFDDNYTPINLTNVLQHSTKAYKKGEDFIPGGIEYLLFSLKIQNRKFKESEKIQAIDKNNEFLIKHVFHKNFDTFMDGKEKNKINGLIASWWLLSVFGGLGARSRRGFGSFDITDWYLEEIDTDTLKTRRINDEVFLFFLDKLPLPYKAADEKDWISSVKKGTEYLLFKAPKADWPDEVPKLNENTLIASKTFKSDKSDLWDVLNNAGLKLSEGRKKYKGGWPDARVTFGLPLKTGKKKIRRWNPDAYKRNRFNRNDDSHASPLRLSIGTWRGGTGQIWSLFDAPRPGIGNYTVKTDGGNSLITGQDAVKSFISNINGADIFKPGGFQKQIAFVCLDVFRDFNEYELPKNLSEELSTAEKLVYTEYGGQRVASDKQSDTDWTNAVETVEKIVNEVKNNDAIYIGGYGHLPLFAFTGTKISRWATPEQILINKNNNKGIWDVIRLNENLDSKVGVELKDIEQAENKEWLAISIGTSEIDKNEIKNYFEKLDIDINNVSFMEIEVPNNINKENGAGVYAELKQVFDKREVSAKKVALFVYGHVTLAYMAGQLLNPNKYEEIHFPLYDKGKYISGIKI